MRESLILSTYGSSKDYKVLVLKQFQGINPQHVLLEPCMRNTAPCIAYASWKIKKEDDDALIVVASSDHLVLRKIAFQNYIKKGFKFLESWEGIITMGMESTEPNIGYGYIEQGNEVFQGEGIYKLKSFREKPDLSTAINYLEQGGFTWNNGMFMWHVNTIIEELRKHASQIAEIMCQLNPYLLTDKEQEKVNDLFPQCDKISIEYAVMEKTDRAYVMPASFGWSDLGTWGSLHSLIPRDGKINAVIGDRVKMIESQGCMVRMPEGKHVIIQGLKVFIVAEHNNILLICQLSSEQNIKDWHDTQ